MRYALALSSIALMTFSATISANEDSSSEYNACIEAAGGVTSDLVSCTSEELAKQDARLNKAYKTAMSVLSAENKRKLKEAQRLWIKFRDADCGMNYSLTGGTMDLLNGSGCELQMTQERADTLEWFAEYGAE